MGNAQFFDSNGNYDFYERAIGRNGGDEDCLDGKPAHTSRKFHQSTIGFQ